jgi:hypothetical protein
MYQLLPRINEAIDKINNRHLHIAMQNSEKFFAMKTSSFINQLEKYISLYEQ